MTSPPSRNALAAGLVDSPVMVDEVSAKVLAGRGKSELGMEFEEQLEFMEAYLDTARQRRGGCYASKRGKLYMESTKPDSTRKGHLEQIVARLDEPQRINLRDLLEAKISGGKEGLRAALANIQKPEPEK